MTDKAAQAATIIEIPLSDIHADHNWNARGQRWQTKATEEDTAFDGLLASIRARGLDDAVEVRPNPDPKSKQKYSLVAGFRRFEAVSKLAGESGNKHATIKAEVKQLNEMEARARNIRENTARESLAVPDLAWSIFKLGQAGLTDVAIADEINKTQSHVSRLHRLVKGTNPKVFDQWRTAIVPLTIPQMETVLTCASDKDQNALFKAQQEKYVELVKKQSEKARVKTDEEKAEAKIETLKAQAEKVGIMLGKLTAMEFLDCSEIDFSAAIEVLVPGCEGLPANKRKTIATAAKNGHKAGVELVNEANEEEEEEGEEAAE